MFYYGWKKKMINNFFVQKHLAYKMCNTIRRLLVAGYGRMGQIRCRDIFANPRLQLAGLIETNSNRKNQFFSHFGNWNIPVYDTIEEAIYANKNIGLQKRQKDLDGIWIATNTDNHVDSILASTPHKLTIGIEKPIATTEEQIRNVYASAEKNKVQIMSSFQRRFDPSYRNLIKKVREEKVLGKIRSIHAIFRDHPLPSIDFLKTGGNIFYDLAVHDTDFICHVLGEAPIQVYAKGSSFYNELKDIGVSDQAVIMLMFPSGCLATLELSRSCAYGYDQRIEFHGEHGAVGVTNPVLSNTTGSFSTGITHDTIQYSFPQRFRKAYRMEMEHFLSIIDKKTTPQVTMEDCILSIKIAKACSISQEQGNPVSL